MLFVTLALQPFLIELHARRNSADPYELVDAMRRLASIQLVAKLDQKAQVCGTEVVLKKGRNDRLSQKQSTILGFRKQALFARCFG